MPRSKRPRKPWHGPQSARDLADLPPAPAAPREPLALPGPAKVAPRRLSRGTLAMIGGATAAAGAGAYLVHRRKNVKKIYDPVTDEEFLVEKSDWAGARVRHVSKAFHQVPSPQLRGDGGFIHLESTSYGWPGREARPGPRGDGQDLKVVRRNRRTTTGATALERYGKADRDRKGGAKVGALAGFGAHAALEGAMLASPARRQALRSAAPGHRAKVLGIGFGTDTAAGAGIGALIGRKRRSRQS